ncbi:MAG: recombination protein O N-terminal domain-containing protein [Bacteroidales bacterium]|nr:recombination protein O N-terminal domain-containing protein [Bacteroidales bacterium]
MIVATRGIVLRLTPYKETSLIGRVFTRQLGVRSYLFKGVRGAKGKKRQSALHPLACIDMVVYESDKTTLCNVKEYSLMDGQDMPTPAGNALAFFASELLYRTLQTDDPMPMLFDYVEHFAQQRDSAPPQMMPLQFMLNLSFHLGIEPLNNYSTSTPLFSVVEGRFVGCDTGQELSPDMSLHLHQLLEAIASNYAPPVMSFEQRSQLLEALLLYYQTHVSGFRKLFSNEIMHDVLR